MNLANEVGLKGADSLQVLWEDGECTFCRQWSDSKQTAVLVVVPAVEHPSQACLERLAHEFSLKDQLDPAWAVLPIELKRDGGRTLLMLQDPGGEPLARRLGSPLDVGQVLPLAIDIAAALGQSHQSGLIHRDLKPAHIMVGCRDGAVRLTGFGIASRLLRERQASEPPKTIAGTLAYMAPEQTGRMNRSVDARSDLYALGITLYQMLTGELPFTAADPMEWVHCHIARQPVPPDQRVKTVPASVSAVVMKLLAKTPEERYQTAAGVAADLRRCLSEWRAHGRIADIQLGRDDIPDRLMIPEKLYGREREIETLRAAFARVVTSGAPELMLVCGYSGIGKSAVVNELHKELVPPRGLFAAGKFDQYKRDIPYATVAQVFQSLVRQILGSDEVELAGWREALRAALGPNGQLMVDLIPELKLIIGEQPPVPELPPHDAHNRFQLVLRRFLGVFARADHPLALFLDDLQWLDAATLKLIEDLLTHPDVRHLLLIGAYRDNEVGTAHPLKRALKLIKSAGGTVEQITLAPLARADVGQLVADALRCEPERAAPLARLVYEKTGGNPFFAIQFLSSLVGEGLLTFNHDGACWVWDVTRIHAKGYTENVVDLMAGKLTRLPVEAQHALRQLACLGNVAEITTLSMVLGATDEQVDLALWPARRQELVERMGGRYRFSHDRIQEAAYALIPEAERPALHLRIGRLLLSQTPAEKREEALFDIVNQLNRGSSLISAPDERERLAELNLAAGKRAKGSTAYAAALSYCVAGQQLLGGEAWSKQPGLAFELELARAECTFLSGDVSGAEERLLALAERIHDFLALARVMGLLLYLYWANHQDDQAIAMGLAYLRRVGIDWSAHPSDAEVEREYQQLARTLAGQAVETLIDLPLMSDPAQQATMEVLSKLVNPAWFTDANLFALVVGRATNLSLEHGHSDFSIFAYGTLPMVLWAQLGRFREGLQFGQLAYDLVERRGLTRFKAYAYSIHGAFVTPWTRPLRDTVDVLRRAFEAALETGDPAWASWARNQGLSVLLASGAPLAQVQQEAEDALRFAQGAGSGFYADLNTVQLQLVRALRGLTPRMSSFNDAGFDEPAFERDLDGHPVRSRLAYRACRYWIRKLQACYLAGDTAAALQVADRAWPTFSEMVVPTRGAYDESSDYCLYAALALAAHCSSLSVDARHERMTALLAHYRRLALWAQVCPQNFADRAALVGAEIARLEGRHLDALRLYDEAIGCAREQGFVQTEALAYELAGCCCHANGLRQLGDPYLQNARACYLRWGADGKVRQLEQLYPQLQPGPVEARPDGSLGLPIASLDLATASKVSQAIAGEIDLTSLLDTLMRLALEHSGASRGLLILSDHDQMRIQAEARTSGGTVVVEPRLSDLTADELPMSLLRYVVRTRERLVLADAAHEKNPYASDPYIEQTRPRALLCLPLLKQAELIGALYLENRLTGNVFDPARLALLELIAGQAVVALENARLYAQTEQARQRERQSAAEFELAFDMIPALAWQTSPAGQIEALNRRFLDYTGLSADDAISGQWLNAFHPDDAGHVFQIWQRCLTSGESGEAEGRMRRADGVYRSFLVRAAPMRNEQGEIIRWFGTNTDIEDLKRAERLLAEEKRLLEMIAAGQPVPALLDTLCRAVEDLADGTCASILLLDPVTRTLHHCAAPSLPESYTHAIDGGRIGPKAGSCGTAAYRGERVFVADIASDPLWADYRDLALTHGLRACWSSPIWASEGTVLGTFALYAPRVRPITTEEERLVEQFTHIASIVIERGRMDADLRASLAEKEALLKEVHHRVKNNLQLISSLLSLQAGKISTPGVAEQLAESRNRVRAMALVHENLYRTGSFARINMAGHIKALCNQLERAYRLQGQKVALTTMVAEVEFDLDRAVAVGLIVNELVSNALKHAFPNGRSGGVEVRLERQPDGRCRLSVRDDGVGLSAGLEVVQTDTMGLQLVRMLTDQLHGSLDLTGGSGTTFTICFNAEAMRSSV